MTHFDMSWTVAVAIEVSAVLSGVIGTSASSANARATDETLNMAAFCFEMVGGERFTHRRTRA